MRASRVWLGAFCCFFVLGATWAFASPLLSVPDEPAHLVKSAAIARGQLTGEKQPVPDEGPGSIFRGGFTVLVDVPESYTWQTSRIPECFIYEPAVPAGCAPEFRDEPGDAQWTTWVGEYPPTYYAAVGWATLVDTGRTGVYLARLWSAALGAAFLATAFACARVSERHRTLAVGVVLAATPMTFFLTGSVNPNGLEIAAAVCFWASLGAVLTTRDHPTPGPLYASVLVSGLVLAWTRPLSVVWLGLAAGVLVLGFGGVRDAVGRVGRGRTVAAGVALGAVGVLALVWAFALDALGNVQGDEPRGYGLLRAVRHSAGRTDDYVRQMVGVFGWRSTFPPVLLVVLWLVVLAAFVGAALWAGRRRARLGVLAAVVLTIVVPIALEAAQAHDRGFGWQGRYGLPLAAGVPITAALALATGRELGRRALRSLTVGTVTIAAVGQVVAHAASTRRYVVGSGGSWWYLTGDGWDPPLPAPILLLAVIAAAAGLAVLAVRVVTGTDERVDATAARPESAPSIG